LGFEYIRVIQIFVSGYLKAKFGSTAADALYLLFKGGLICGMNFRLKFLKYKPIYIYPAKIGLKVELNIGIP